VALARRFYVLQVALPAAVVNLVINALVGPLVYPSGQTVPSLGDKSAGLDCLVGAFIIGFCSWVLVVGAGQVEARAGRVAGRDQRWLRGLVRHRWLAAFGFALAWVTLAGVPVVAALTRWAGPTVPRAEFLLFKVAFAVVVGVLAGLSAALAGAASEPRVDFTLPPPAPGLTSPCDATDKAGLAITDPARGCSVTPTWQLVVRGPLDVAHVRTALADLTQRYPSLRMQVQALDGAPPYCRKLQYVEVAPFRLDDVFAEVDLRATPDQLPHVERELKNRPLDLFTQFPMTLTLLRLEEQLTRLAFRQHHAIADGRAFIGLLADFSAFLELARRGVRPAPEALAPIHRRGEAEALGVTGTRRTAWTLAGHALHLKSVARALLRPTVALLQNSSLDYRGDNETLHWRVEDGAFERWQATRKALKVSLNSYLCAAWAEANRRWHVELARPLGRTLLTMPVETRPRDPGFASFANHLGSMPVSLDLGAAPGVPAMAASVQAQVTQQRDSNAAQKRLLSQLQVMSGMTLADIHRVVYEQPRPLTNLDFSNLIALEFPAMGGEGWSVDEVRITTPVSPRTGVVLTVIRYRERVMFNLNFKTSVVERALAEGLLRHFQAVLAN
jgi:hypothetical protein